MGKEHFKFEIIAEYKNKRSLRYYELYYQMKFNVLSSILEGTDEPAYYNSRVGGKFYRPVESYEDPEYLKKLSETISKAYKNNLNLKKKRITQLNKDRNTRRDPVTGRYIKKNVQAKKK